MAQADRLRSLDLLRSSSCTILFSGYGLNYYAALPYYQLCLVAGAWVGQRLASPLWLRYFLFGPPEWLWRSLTYRRGQPRRPAAAVSAAPLLA